MTDERLNEIRELDKCLERGVKLIAEIDTLRKERDFWRDECEKRVELLKKLEWAGRGRSIEAAIRNEGVFPECPKCGEGEGGGFLHTPEYCELARLMKMPEPQDEQFELSPFGTAAI